MMKNKRVGLDKMDSEQDVEDQEMTNESGSSFSYNERTTTTTPSSSNNVRLGILSENSASHSSDIRTPASASTSSSSHLSFVGRSRSKSYAETSSASKREEAEGSIKRRLFTPASSNLSSSLISAFQMPQNIAQVLPNLPNINMSSLPDYFASQLPSVSMPTMPNISIPSIPISMPSISNLSMPNISMPAMPSIPNLNIPSISEIMNFPVRKCIKSWSQIFSSVHDARKRHTEVCPPLPFSFNSFYSAKMHRHRLYFLASKDCQETTLFYCDIPDEGYEIDDNFQQEFNSSMEDISVESKVAHFSSNSSLSNTVNDGSSTSRLSASLDLAAEENDDIDFDIDNENTPSSKSSMRSMSSSSSTSVSYTETEAATLLRNSVTSPISSLDIHSIPTLKWHLLIGNRVCFSDDDFTPDQEAGRSSAQSKSTQSREEDLALQRKRMLFNGVVSYDFHPQIPRIVFTVKNILYWFDDVQMMDDATEDITDCDNSQENVDEKCKEIQSHLDTNMTKDSENTESESKPKNKSKLFKNIHYNPPYLPYKLVTPHTKLNATICPDNPDLVAYLADNDLWVAHLGKGIEIRLTKTKYAKTCIMAGRPSFVMQEEFSRFTGFWWRPTNGKGYTLLCEFVDESLVDLIALPNWDGTIEPHRFPKAGRSNAISTLKLVHFSDKLKNVHIESLEPSLDSIFPEYEYLIRANWYSEDVIWAQLLNRLQDKLVIVFISVSKRFPAQIIYEEVHTGHWYNCHDVFYFFQNQCNYSSMGQNEENITSETELTVGSKVQFLWSSEESGYRHLYRITVQLVDKPDFTCQPTTNELDTSSQIIINHTDPIIIDKPTESNLMRSGTLQSKLVNSHQITNGKWEVSSSEVWVDESNDLIYFIGSKDSPLECHLYVVNSKQSSRGSPRRITKEDYTHSRLYFFAEKKLCIDFFSNLTVPPFAKVHLVMQPDQLSHLTLEPLYFFLAPNGPLQTYDEQMDCLHKNQLGPTPQLFEYKLQSGELIYGFLFKPDFMEPGVKYPVLLEIYGGPEVQLVSKSFRDVRQHRRHMIASEGYIVVGFDSRGSKRRGVEFERHIYKRLGQVEIKDQVEALLWLAENTGFMDINRVAIHGWSYGGYLSLMGLALRPDIFKCAIAGAPVTDWRLYDTGYTERYMGLPDENAEAYRMSNVLTYVRFFPNEHNRLLIIHGLMDENVHFTHTAQLINCLVAAGKPYSLNIFPYERHSLRKLHCSEHYEATLLHYLQQNL